MNINRKVRDYTELPTDDKAGRADAVCFIQFDYHPERGDICTQLRDWMDSLIPTTEILGVEAVGTSILVAFVANMSSAE